MNRLSALLLALAVGCGAPDTCPADVPGECSAPAPSYATEVAPIFLARCGGCHAAGGVEASRNLQSYADVYRQRSAVLNQLAACRMPPQGQTPPTAAERALLLHWLVCGAPNN